MPTFFVWNISRFPISYLSPKLVEHEIKRIPMTIEAEILLTLDFNLDPENTKKIAQSAMIEIEDAG